MKKMTAFKGALADLELSQPLARGSLEAEFIHYFSSGEKPVEEDEAIKIARSITAKLRDIEDPLTARLRDVSEYGAAQGTMRQQQYDDLADEVRTLYDKFELTRRV